MKELSEKQRELFGKGTPLEVFYNALKSSGSEKLLKGTFNDDLLSIPAIVVNAHYGDGSVTMKMASLFDLENESGNNLAVGLVAKPSTQRTSRTLEVVYDTRETPFTLDFRRFYGLSFGNGVENDSNNVLFFGEDVLGGGRANDVVSVRVKLYEDVQLNSFVEHDLPVAYATFKLRRQSSQNIFDVLKVVLTVDFDPGNPEVVMYESVLDVLPELTEVGLHVGENVSFSQRDQFHRDLSAAFASSYEGSEQESAWCFESNGGRIASKNVKSDKQRVFLGDIFNTFFTFALLSQLKTLHLLESLHDPEFLRQTLSKTEHGVALAGIIENVLSSYWQQRQLEAKNTFPSLYQVLRHTTGLPQVNALTLNDVQKKFADMEKIIKSPHDKSLRDGLAKDFDHDQALTKLINSLAQTDSVENPIDAIVGDQSNIFEAVILHVFCTTLLEQSPLQFTANVFYDNFGVELQTFLKKGRSYDHPSALATNFAHMRFKDLVEVLGKIYESNRMTENFRLSDMFVAPTYLQPNTHLASSLGWMCFRSGNNVDVFFSMSNQFADLDTTVVVVIPQFGFWGVFHENTLTRKFPLRLDGYEVVNAILSVVQNLDVSPSHVQSIDFLPQSFYAHEHAVVKAEEKLVISYKDFIDPYSAFVNKQATSIRLFTWDDGSQSLKFGDTEITLVPVEGFDEKSEDGKRAYYQGNNSYSPDKIFISDREVYIDGHLYISAEESDRLFKSLNGVIGLQAKKKEQDIHSVFSSSSSSSSSSSTSSSQAPPLLPRPSAIESGDNVSNFFDGGEDSLEERKGFYLGIGVAPPIAPAYYSSPPDGFFETAVYPGMVYYPSYGYAWPGWYAGWRRGRFRGGYRRPYWRGGPVRRPGGGGFRGPPRGGGGRGGRR
ncbi:MAG: hypothetical protein BVN35_17625 [Proteobacteria bacterium ST_bin11]|nr:MAG: hypothetical protein BVN35_17625 [Proteobacteria bacterium ST_bin11]